MSEVIKIEQQVTGNPLGGLNVRIAKRGGDIHSAYDDRQSKADGTLAFVGTPPGDYTLFINESGEGWYPVDATYGGTHVDVTFPLPEGFTVGLRREPLPRLFMASPYYLNVPITGTIGFADYYRWRRGEKDLLKTIYKQLQGVKGHNSRSILFSCDDMFRLHPEEDPDFYNDLDNFADFITQFGFWPFVVFIADGGAAFSSEGAARAHWVKMKAWVEKWGFAGKGANEATAHENFPWNLNDDHAWPTPAVPFGYHCYIGGGPEFDPDRRQGDFVCFHPIRRGNGRVKDLNVYDHPARQKDDDPDYPADFRWKGVGIGEPDGLGLDPRGPVEGRHYSTDPKYARELGVGTAMGTACFHFCLTPRGKLSMEYDEQTLDLVKAFFGM